MSNNSKETMTKKQQDDLNSSLNSNDIFDYLIKILFIIICLDLNWGLPLGFSSLSPFGAFPGFGLPTPNFPPLNSFASPPTTAFPPSLLSNESPNPSTDLWSNGLSTGNNPLDYNEYAKQLGFLMNAFTEQEADKSKSKRSHSSSPNTTNGKKHENNSRRSSRAKQSSTNNESPMLDPLTFAAATGLTFPYFLPSLLSQTPSTTGTNTNHSTYPFSALANPTAGLYPFLTPDWLTSSVGNLTPESKPSKKRSKSIRTLTEEQEKNSASLLHSALVYFILL
jgi:hypothetical protein